MEDKRSSVSHTFLLRIVLVTSIALLYLSAYLLYQQEPSGLIRIEIIDAFRLHYLLLLSFSLFISFLLHLLPGHHLLLSFRFALSFLCLYPLGLDSDLSTVLALLFLLETAVFLSPLFQCIYTFFFLVMLFSLGSGGSAYGFVRPAMVLSLRLARLIYPVFGALLLFLLNLACRRIRNLESYHHHLEGVIGQLSHVNLDFQRYVHSVENSAISAERRRISREIHDTVGYSLTNISMTLEAAKELLFWDRQRARDAVEHSLQEARDCLEETRCSMRKIRSQDLKEAVGLQAIAHLARSFSEATGMKISVEYGNAPDSFGSEIDLLLFRVVQEGVTNAFRHGKAGYVKILFWLADGMLTVLVNDDGQGATELVEGIGLSGMQERVESAGGELSYTPRPDGFRVRVCIPYPRKEEGDG